jgi:hypothetical protein
MRDISTTLSVTPTILPAAGRTNGTVNGTSVDLANFDNAVVVVHAGVITDGSHVVTVEESDVSGSGFTTVAAADLVDGDLDGVKTPTLTTGGGNGGSRTHEIGYVGRKRFIRAVVVTSGATTGGFIDASVVRGTPKRSPVA